MLRFSIVDDEVVGGKNSGKRAITRNFRDANASDAGRIRRVEFDIWGPIGASLFSTSNKLAIDFVQNLETRWERRLTSAGAQTGVTLTGFDPPGTGSFFGTSYFGSSYFGSTVGGQNVVVFDETQGFLFAERGRVSTQVSLNGTWTVINSQELGAEVLDSTHWYGKVYLAMGPSIPLQRRTGANSSFATYQDTVATSPPQTVYASAIKRGSDRAWYVDATNGGSTFNFAGYTLDGFLNLAAPFQVGDPQISVNGIGPFGPLTDFGSADNIYSFTDQGKPVPLSQALDAIHSTLNGSQFADPGFGWLYYTSVAGLRAHALPGYDNPIGVGERMRSFTGHNGIPSAIFAARGELFVIYKTSAGNLYGYRGVFGPETASTGQPLFFPWFYQASATSNAIFSSTTPNIGTQELTIIRADGTNLKYQYISADGRDDLDTSLVYSTAGGVAYLTTFDKDPNLLKTLRLARLRPSNMVSGDSWALAVGFDTKLNDPVGSSYTSIGTVTTNGEQTIQPVSASTPIASISGHTLKPRLTQVAGGAGASTTPPELDGTLELEYDERPDQIEEIEVVIEVDQPLSQNYMWDVLRQLVGSSTNGPFQIQLPDDQPPAVSTSSGGGKKYAMLQKVESRQDIIGNGIEAVHLLLEVWPSAVAL